MTGGFGNKISTSGNRGLITAALIQIRGLCEAMGIRALTVEVGHHKAPAQAVYRRAGFVEAADRHLLALALASVVHAVLTLECTAGVIL